MPKEIARRTMLKAAAAATATSLFPPRVHGANNRLNVAFIGTGSMGLGHVGACARMDDINIVAVCDVDEAHQRRAAEIAGGRPRTYTDFRAVLDRNDVDVVVIATPDHWHPLIAVRAFDAGIDVYTEKPLGHNIREGRMVADAARAHKRVCQVGLQQRSGPHWQHAVERIRNGEIGVVSMVHAWNAWKADEMRGGFGHPPDAEPPVGVDYDLWLGPAPARTFNPARFHLYWCYFWDYSGGMVSGWGVHLFDIVQWAMGHDIGSVSASGGKFVLDDSRETPDTLEAIFKCPKYTLTYSMRHASGWRPFGDMDHGIEFFGDTATLQINRGGFQIFREEDRDSRQPFYKEHAEGNDYDGHLRNFFACARSREQPRCDAETGHRSTIYSHLANIAYRTGRTMHWNGADETVPGDPEAQKLLTREYRKPWVL
ncbi:MAG: Gfo/Idh/MocA family oxidoreductase [Candidatus Hydrogenedentes bacterium]|nr:Gfo/Idh/MocA family oxidoreductase [Candidatus Hydrogenedentota bacterium]